MAVQTGLLFFVPFAVAVLHAAFALQMFGQLLSTSVWGPMAAVSLVYLALYTLYYLAARRAYVRALLQG